MCEDMTRLSESSEQMTNTQAAAPTAAQTEAERKEQLLAAYEEWYARHIAPPDSVTEVRAYASGGKA